MNIKAWNIKKGLKRFWIIGSVFWFLYSFIPFLPWDFPDHEAFIFGVIDFYPELGVVVFWFFSQIIWWGLLYLGFWVARGFVDDDDKKAGF